MWRARSDRGGVQSLKAWLTRWAPGAIGQGQSQSQLPQESLRPTGYVPFTGRPEPADSECNAKRCRFEGPPPHSVAGGSGRSRMRAPHESLPNIRWYASRVSLGATRYGGRHSPIANRGFQLVSVWENPKQHQYVARFPAVGNPSSPPGRSRWAELPAAALINRRPYQTTPQTAQSGRRPMRIRRKSA
jgi:hypothetical protein